MKEIRVDFRNKEIREQISERNITVLFKFAVVCVSKRAYFIEIWKSVD